MTSKFEIFSWGPNCENKEICKNNDCWRAILIDQQLELARKGMPHSLVNAVGKRKCKNASVNNLVEQSIPYL